MGCTGQRGNLAETKRKNSLGYYPSYISANPARSIPNGPDHPVPFRCRRQVPACPRGVKKIQKMENKMKVEIWSDIICPYCYIGKRNFTLALADFPYLDRFVVEWKSFPLDPSLPEVPNHQDNLYRFVAELAQSVAMHEQLIQYAQNLGLI